MVAYSKSGSKGFNPKSDLYTSKRTKDNKILKKMLLDTRIMITALAVVGLITTLTGVYGQEEEGIDASRISSPGPGGPSSGTTGPIGGGTLNPYPEGGHHLEPRGQ
jgi:hypothetical protein